MIGTSNGSIQTTSCPKQALVVSMPVVYGATETIVESTINLGGHHGTYACLGLLIRRVRGAGGSDFGD